KAAPPTTLLRHSLPASISMFVSTPLPSVQSIHARLGEIFPPGLGDRNYVVREAAARTVFAALYIDAVEGQNIWLAPVHVYRMSDTQAAKQSDAERTSYVEAIASRRYRAPEDRWMQDNSREQIRDETLAQGFCTKGAVIERPDVVTTASLPRYALQRDFAAL